MIFITSYQGYVQSTHSIIVDVVLNHLVEIVFVRFSLCKVHAPSAPCTHTLYSLEGSHLCIVQA